METKSFIRKRILAVRNQIPQTEHMEKSRLIAEKLYSLQCYQEAKVVLGFVGYGGEVDTMPILEKAVLDGKKVYCPVSEENGRMVFYRFTSAEQLVKGYKNIPEPLRAEPFVAEASSSEEHKVFMLMPGVVFDRERHRIGYGKGFYDRYLSAFKPDATVAVCFLCQVVEKVPVEEHDFIPDMVITESEIL